MRASSGSPFFSVKPSDLARPPNVWRTYAVYFGSASSEKKPRLPANPTAPMTVSTTCRSRSPLKAVASSKTLERDTVPACAPASRSEKKAIRSGVLSCATLWVSFSVCASSRAVR